MIIFYELICFLLYQSILVSVVNNLETSDDSFNDLDGNLLPDQLLLQQDIDIEVAQVDSWFNQIDIVSTNITLPVLKVSAPEITNYVGLYFIIEKPANISSGINFLHHHLRILNRYLSNFHTLCFIAGVAHVPPLPANLTNVIHEKFINGVRNKLTDILKDRYFGAIVSVFVFFQKLESLTETRVTLCQGVNIPVLYWFYKEKDENINADDYLFQGIVLLLGGCTKTCIQDGSTISCDNFYETSFKLLPDDLIQCLNKNIQESGNLCTKKVPENVLIPVCGNGIVEDTEVCDCLILKECGSQCGTSCTLKNGFENVSYRYLILIIAALIIIAIIIMSSLYIFVYFKKLSTFESRGSVMSIIPGEYKSELSGSKSRIKSKLETVILKEVKVEPEKKSSKIKNELPISKTSSTKTLDTKKSTISSTKSMSKSRISSKNVTTSFVSNESKSKK